MTLTEDKGNWTPGEKVPRTGTYKCIYCGPDGLGASLLKHTMESMGLPYTPPTFTRKTPPRRFLSEGDTFPTCPNCSTDPVTAGKTDPTGWDFVSDEEVTATATHIPHPFFSGWDFVSDEEVTATAKSTPQPNLVYFECTRPPGDGKCSDDSCPCGYPGADIPRGSGYFYISKELVEMRRDALTITELQKKVRGMQQRMGATMMMAGQGVFMPILMCELAAKKRGINLEVAAADAKHYWETGMAPLRPTTMAGEGGTTPSDKVDSRCFVDDAELKTRRRWNAVSLLFAFILLVLLVVWWSFLAASRQSATRMPTSNASNAAPVQREPKFVLVTVASARIRERPSLDASIVTIATEAQRFSIRSKRDEWYEVAAPERPGVTIGYIHESLVRPGDR